MLVGIDPDPALQTPGVSWAGRLSAPALRNFYGAADVLVVPSIPTRTSRETWGLVVNEAFNQHLPVIASDAVGAAAGGLVQDGANGLIVPAGDAGALAAAIRRLATDPDLRARMGERAALDVRAYSHDAWAEGFSRALGSLGLSLRPAGSAGRAGSVA
jgi:glycosyltransferase involved in cell wall biosynthesis